MDGSAPERHGLLPLTVFDQVFERTAFVTGWLVEGTVDSEALELALQRVTDKWRMLAGRIQSQKEGNETRWVIRVPLGPLPPHYRTFALTKTTSECPLSTYVPIPIPQVSASLPPLVFIHPSTPRQYVDWEKSSHPLTCWHLTYFPALQNNGRPYTAIGFARSHGVFDGVGAALVMNALVAEMQGKEWTPPPLPSEGLNVNPFIKALEECSHEVEPKKGEHEYKGYSPLGVPGFTKLITWHLREKQQRGADRRILLLPKNALTLLVKSVRTELRKEHKQIGHITSGDILVAWAYKTIYANGESPNTLIHCTNLAAIRSLLTENPIPSDRIMQYAHNAFIPIPYPVLSVAEVQAFSLHDLTNLLAVSRLSLSKEHVVSAYKTLQLPTLLFPTHPDADESLMVSNVSASRILESDWTTIGAKRTICGYRYQVTPSEVLFTNALYIAGRLDDGTVVLDVSFNKARFELFATEIQKLSSMASVDTATIGQPV